MKFKPTSSLQRHQKYFGAFFLKLDREIVKGTSLYLDYITKFITDPNISHLNEDDLWFLKDLLFESQYGKVHIEYYTWILNNWLDYAFPQAIKILARYADFLGQVDRRYLDDFFHTIMIDSQDAAIAIFECLSSTNKVEYINIVGRYPAIVERVPKLKLYITFS